MQFKGLVYSDPVAILHLTSSEVIFKILLKIEFVKLVLHITSLTSIKIENRKTKVQTLLYQSTKTIKAHKNWAFQCSPVQIASFRYKKILKPRHFRTRVSKEEVRSLN